MSYHICEVDGVHLKKTSMSNHKKSVHVTSRLFNCDQCSQKFKNKRDVTTHVSKVHVEAQFLCAECQKLFFFLMKPLQESSMFCALFYQSISELGHVTKWWKLNRCVNIFTASTIDLNEIGKTRKTELKDFSSV